MLSIGTNTAAYLTYHSYGQYLFTPWGYTSDLPDDYNELVRELWLVENYFFR